MRPFLFSIIPQLQPNTSHFFPQHSQCTSRFAIPSAYRGNKVALPDVAVAVAHFAKNFHFHKRSMYASPISSLSPALAPSLSLSRSHYLSRESPRIDGKLVPAKDCQPSICGVFHEFFGCFSYGKLRAGGCHRCPVVFVSRIAGLPQSMADAHVCSGSLVCVFPHRFGQVFRPIGLLMSHTLLNSSTHSSCCRLMTQRKLRERLLNHAGTGIENDV